MYRESLPEVNQRLEAALASVAERDRLTRIVAGLETRLDALETVKRERAKIARAERNDVVQLESRGIASLFFSVLGTRAEKLDRERREAVAAELKLAEASAEIQTLDTRCAQLREQLASLATADEELDRARSDKETWLARHDGPVANEIIAYAEAIGTLRAHVAETNEALSSGGHARDCLDEVAAALDDAADWGAWDLLGGGAMTTHVKHGYLDEANAAATRAQEALSQFGIELADVQREADIRLELDAFTTFADYFFDNLVTDWAVQSKIADSQDAVRDVRAQVERALASLAEEHSAATTRLRDIENRRLALLDRF